MFLVKASDFVETLLCRPFLGSEFAPWLHSHVRVLQEAGLLQHRMWDPNRIRGRAGEKEKWWWEELNPSIIFFLAHYQTLTFSLFFPSSCIVVFWVGGEVRAYFGGIKPKNEQMCHLCVVLYRYLLPQRVSRICARICKRFGGSAVCCLHCHAMVVKKTKCGMAYRGVPHFVEDVVEVWW